VNTYQCANRHCFDIAKEGYVNLLLVQHKRSVSPGDGDEMIRSRQRFLNAGYYRPLADAIVKQVLQLGANQRVLDIGCGEGYYMEQLRSSANNLELYGIDISKTAVRMAAKRKLNAQLAVDSAYNIPLIDSSINTALSVFSPISAIETARVLTPKGRLIMIGPGAEHLAGLTAHIYENTVPHEGNPLNTTATDSEFNLLETIELNQEITVRLSHVEDLLKMTPYYWHARPEQQEAICALKELTTTVHFVINIYAPKEATETAWLADE
jgi:23S rRNA (guanine745-N1)-methyltransferase